MQLLLATLVLILCESAHARCVGKRETFYQISINFTDFKAYELIVLRPDGSVFVIDNIQNGFSPNPEVETQPFTDTVGQWRCAGSNRLRLHVINYNLRVAGSKTPSTLSFDQYSLTLSNNGENIQGTFRFAYYALGANPMRPNTSPLPGLTFGPFPVSGERFRFF